MPAAAATDIHNMSLPPDQMPLAKPKISSEERRRRRRTADQLTMIRLKMAIGRVLDERSITAPAEVAAALGMPAAEATKLLPGIDGARAPSNALRLRRRGWG